ncbi:MAG: YdbL family protein [Desulfobacterales bacterium]|jgi:uncharacterized protein YdbL (DUF1318 family)
MNRTPYIPLVIGGIALALALLVTAAASADPLQDRMKARLPQIVSLKSKGVIGENHKGYLEFVGNSREGADIVEGENADRRQLYSAVAKKTGASADQVGARAALKWKKNLGKGEFFKNPDGTWMQK